MGHLIEAQAFMISSACVLLFGLRKIFLMIPFSSIRKVVRCNPRYFRPYSCFSPQTPYLSMMT